MFQICEPTRYLYASDIHIFNVICVTKMTCGMIETFEAQSYLSTMIQRTPFARNKNSSNKTIHYANTFAQHTLRRRIHAFDARAGFG